MSQTVQQYHHIILQSIDKLRNVTLDDPLCSSKFLFDKFMNNYLTLEDVGNWESWEWKPTTCKLPNNSITKCIEKYERIAVLGDSYGNRYGNAIIYYFKKLRYRCKVDRRYH
ncbi:hypothetical protein SNEBB_001161, partial [Seison nebaliae]